MSNNTTAQKTSFGTPEQRGNVTIYPALPSEMLRVARGQKLRTAAYVRVSTDSIQQEGSLVLQKEYYENHIKSNPEYKFVGIYEDDGVSATSVEKRKGFLKMMYDCKAGKIDLIITKSISRFARNVGDLLHSINVLNALKPPVEIRFEMENISTFSPMGEMLITVLGILAQWESQIKSEAITWAIDRLFAQGKFYSPAIYGYTKEKGRDKPLVINEDEAKIVRLCFAMTLVGYSFPEITNILNTLGIKGRNGKTDWKTSGIISLLSHEKYAGELIARKTVTPNYKTHKSKKNEGEKHKYHDKKHHDPIVPPLAHDIVGKMIKKNRRGGTDGIPYLKAVPQGALKGFVTVNKAVRYTLENYIETSMSVYEKEINPEISISVDKISKFDFRKCETVSSLLFDNSTKPSCTIKGGKIIFNAACRKLLEMEKVEILFHPTKAILALRSPVNEKPFLITKPIHLSSFVPVALESVGLKSEYRYRMIGTKRTKNSESVMFFDLLDAEIVPDEKKHYIILPEKFFEHYGDGFYENISSCNLHKIDFDGLWQALHESKITDSLAGQIVELNKLCQTSLTEFGLLTNDE